MKARQGYKLVQGKPRYVKYEIPEEWNVSDLKSVSKKIADIDHKMPNKTNFGVKFIAANNLNDDEIDFKNAELISESDYLAQSKKFNAEKNDILISRIGSIGVARKIRTNERFIASYSVALIKPKESIDSEFLHYYLNSTLPQKVMKAYTIVSGNVNLVLGALAKVPVLLPPTIEEQQKIASILLNVDAQMQQTQKLIDLTQRLKKGLMQKLLTRGIGHTKFKKISWYFGKDIEIPEEWEVVKFRSMIKMEYGSGLTEEKRDNFGNPVYGSGGLIGLHSKPIVNGPGIIVARKGSLGNVFFENDDFFPIDTVYYITEKQTEIDLQFLFYYLLHMKLENLRIVTSKPGISRDDVYSYRILSIPLPEQQKIASILLNVDEQIQQHKNEKALLERLKNGLMQQLLTGQRRVKVGV